MERRKNSSQPVFTQQYEVKNKPSTPAYLIKLSVIDRIRKKVLNLKEYEWFANIGFFSLGVSVSTFLTLIVVDNNFKYREHLKFSSFAFFIIGLALCFIGYIFKKDNSYSKNEILEEIDSLKSDTE